jgi:hypothetical protein
VYLHCKAVTPDSELVLEAYYPDECTETAARDHVQSASASSHESRADFVGDILSGLVLDELFQRDRLLRAV